MFEYATSTITWITVDAWTLDDKNNDIKYSASFPLNNIRLLQDGRWRGKPCCVILLAKEGVMDRIDAVCTKEEFMKIITGKPT